MWAKHKVATQDDRLQSLNEYIDNPASEVQYRDINNCCFAEDGYEMYKVLLNTHV